MPEQQYAQKVAAQSGGVYAQVQSYVGEPGMPASELDQVCNRLGEILTFVVHQAERLETIESKLNGSYPTKDPSAASPPRPVPNGKIALMNAGIDEIMARLQRADEVISKLRNAI